MTRKMLINAHGSEELRIAVITDGKLDRYEVAAAESGLYRGNIYRGVVASIQPSLSAAFVEIGVERHGLLKADDVVPAAYHRKVDGDNRRSRHHDPPVAIACQQGERTEDVEVRFNTSAAQVNQQCSDRHLADGCDVSRERRPWRFPSQHRRETAQ